MSSKKQSKELLKERKERKLLYVDDVDSVNIPAFIHNLQQKYGSVLFYPLISGVGLFRGYIVTGATIKGAKMIENRPLGMKLIKEVCLKNTLKTKKKTWILIHRNKGIGLKEI